MNFHNFESVVSSQKTQFAMTGATESFSIAPARSKPYIKPDFTKVEFAVEKPQVILVSAVGATGKSALAQVLSHNLKLPLLDLGLHKPVGDNTLTGLLTSSFSVEQLSPIFHALSVGEFGVIVDGVDEGRSKTTEKAFHAFLDDIARLCRSAKSTSFVLLGRTQILEECWVYLMDSGISTGLLTIDPFTIDQAKEYIDKSTGGRTSGQQGQYLEARDALLEKLSSAFRPGDSRAANNFLSFIGYPPVLDAIATLLEEEKNYYRLREQLDDSGAGDVEIDLLNKIAIYILNREKSDKVLPNIVEPLICDIPSGEASVIRTGAFDVEEQCVRLVSFSLGEDLSFSRIAHPLVNSQYEGHLEVFLPEHPFLHGREFRNAVFEAVSLSRLISSTEGRWHDLALRCIDSRKDSYYLVYFLALCAPGGKVPLKCLRALVGASLEFKATNASVEILVDGSAAIAPGPESGVDVQIEIVMQEKADSPKTFVFQADLEAGNSVQLGGRLASTYISLPCEVSLAATMEIELTAPVEIVAKSIVLRAPTLVLRTQPQVNSRNEIFFESEKITSEITKLVHMGASFMISVSDLDSLYFPLVQHAVQRSNPTEDPSLLEKYLKLRRILGFFRSHSKGELAKFKDKIDHPRVAGNRVGTAILERLVNDSVVYAKGSFYFLQPDLVDKHLGISWIYLRQGKCSDKLLEYLASIEVTD